MWGIVPAAGRGSRIQPLAFSKELLPVGSRLDAGVERPCAVSEYLLERMVGAGATKICFVISPGKSDILAYYGGGFGLAAAAYVVQPNPSGLCDAIFRAAPLVAADEPVIVGLPDTVWFPENGFAALPDDCLSFLLFPVDRPEFFDAVVCDAGGFVSAIEVKRPGAASNWIWGGFKMPGRVLHALYDLWVARNRHDEYMGTLVNAYIAAGGLVRGVKAGTAYVDVGTLNGYRAALSLLGQADPPVRQAAPLAHHGEAAYSPHRAARTAAMTGPAALSPDEIRHEVETLGPWFHNMNLGGVWTAPGHFLGDYPGVKFRSFAHVLPADLTGKTVLDIGCNGGFYAIEMKRRGAARVLGVDFDEEYLAQARFAARVTGQDIEFLKMSVYDLGQLGERFDLVIFMGVLYHLRHPLLALDIIHDTVAKDLLLFQSLQRGSAAVDEVKENYAFTEAEHFEQPGYPKMHFIEHRYADDPTNWWAPNAACSAAMLRSAGFAIVEHPEEEVYLCRRAETTTGGAVYPPRGRS